MSLISHLQERAQEITGVVFREAGFTIHLGSGDKIDGRDPADREAIDYIKDRGIPAVLMGEGVSYKAVSALPVIGDEGMCEGPITPFSRVPFSVYANLAEKIGGTAYNVPKMDFIEDMFSRGSTAHSRALGAFMSSDENALGDVLAEAQNEPATKWDLPKEPEFDLFGRCISQLERARDKHQADSDKFLDKWRYANKTGSDSDMTIFTKHLANQKAASNVDKLINNVTWNAMMVKAGNISHIQAWNSIREFSDIAKEDVTIEVSRNGSDTHPHVHQAAELSEGAFNSLDALARAAINITEREMSSPSHSL